MDSDVRWWEIDTWGQKEWKKKKIIIIIAAAKKTRNIMTKQTVSSPTVRHWSNGQEKDMEIMIEDAGGDDHVGRGPYI